MAAGVTVLAAAIGGTWWFATRRPPAPPELRPVRITANPAERPVYSGVISPDGKYLAYGDSSGIHVRLTSSGEMQTLAGTGGMAPVSWFPDAATILAVTAPGAKEPAIFTISTLGGTPRKLRDNVDSAVVSPDGSMVTFATRGSPREFYLMGTHGEEPRKLLTIPPDEAILWAAWAPDSKRLAYIRGYRVAGRFFSEIRIMAASGGAPALLLSEEEFKGRITSVVWLAGGRIVFSSYEPPPHARDCNLWEIRPNARGEAAGPPRRMTDWTGFDIDSLSATSDGSRLCFMKYAYQTDVYVSDLEAGGTRMSEPRRLTLDERNDAPTAWTPDGKSVLFSSDRNGTWDLYKQDLGSENAEWLAGGPDNDSTVRLAPDGASAIYVARPLPGTGAAPSRIMRVPLSGGTPQQVLTSEIVPNLTCARMPANFCVYSAPKGGKNNFFAFDPVQGNPRQLFATGAETTSGSWSLAPDGSRIAACLMTTPRNVVRVLDLKGATERDITIEGVSGLNSIDWQPDMRGFFLAAWSPTAGATLLHADLQGRSQVLWKQKGSFRSWGVPSPDGKHLAILGQTMDANVWSVGTGN